MSAGLRCAPRCPPACLAGRLLLSGLLAGLLLSATGYREELYCWLGASWAGLVTRLGLAPGLPALLRPGGPLVQLAHRARSLPAVGLYGGLYLGLCLGLLFVLLPTRPARRTVLRLYGGAGAALGLLLLGSRLGGDPALAGLAGQLGQLLLSPLPVMGLVPLLRGPTALRDLPDLPAQPVALP
jgi:hypothetical protein